MNESNTLDIKFLEKFVNQPSPSGFEGIAQQAFRKYTESFSDEIQADVMGNLTAVINPNGNPRVMLLGHVDEVGLQVKEIDVNGFIYVWPIGGVDRQLVPGTRVSIITESGTIFGVVAKLGLKLQTPEQKRKTIPIEDLFLDIGADSKDEVLKKGIKVGDPVAFQGNFQKLGDSGKIIARCFDDKVGVFLVSQILKTLTEFKDIHPFSSRVMGVSAVQEEIGARGSIVATYQNQPTIGFVFDVTSTTDIPQVNGKILGSASLGKGPIVYRGPNMNPILFNLIEQTAREIEIPIQIRAYPRESKTDARHVQLARNGVATMLISIPLRYMHSTVEVVHLDDLEMIVRLMVTTIRKLTPDMSFIPF